MLRLDISIVTVRDASMGPRFVNRGCYRRGGYIGTAAALQWGRGLLTADALLTRDEDAGEERAVHRGRVQRAARDQECVLSRPLAQHAVHA